MTQLYVRIAEPVVVGQSEGDVVFTDITAAVQHTDGGVSVLSSFENMAEFLKAYVEVPINGHMDDIAMRMALERAQLNYRLNRLHQFMRSETYRTLDAEEVKDLRDQCEAMDQYLLALSDRLARRLLKLHPSA